MTDVEETEEPNYPAYLGKAPTILQARMAGWLQSDAVGYDPAAAKSKREAFEEGVRLGVALRMPFQASAFNRAENARVKAENAARREAAVTEEAPAPAPVVTPKPAKAAKAVKPAPVKAAPKKAPAPVAEAPVVKAAPARRAPARRAPVAAGAPAAADAPF